MGITDPKSYYYPGVNRQTMPIRCVKIFFLILIIALGMDACSPKNPTPGRKWYRGNLHTHSFWSDGNDYPEVITAWYKQHGYNFLAISDHNVLQEGPKWVTVDSSDYDHYMRYVRLFGDRWVEVEPLADSLSDGDAELWRVRLKTMTEYRSLFEEPGKFLLIKSEEISDRFENKPIHVNATNVQKLISPQRGTSVVEVLQHNVDAILDQAAATNKPILPHINHPNFGFAIMAEELAEVHGDNFFEVYNGHPLVHNSGDSAHLSTDAMWDYLLTQRLVENGALFYGLAVDDAHHYSKFDVVRANPGRGWVMVHATGLTPAGIISALESGDFYASSGVVLDSIWHTSQKYGLAIQPRPGVQYTTQFIVTLADHPEQRGIVRATSSGLAVEYAIQGDELYVRAKVVSSRLKENPGTPGELEQAWVQPVRIIPGSR